MRPKNPFHNKLNLLEGVSVLKCSGGKRGKGISLLYRTLFIEKGAMP